jgi:protein O-GlcNAc transferase
LALLEKREFEEATNEFRQAIRLKPEYAAAHYNLALALQGLGDSDAAGAEARRANQLDPKLRTP